MGQVTSTALPAAEDQTDGSNGSDDKRVLVIGAGNFGTCLADHLATIENEVYIWARDKKIVDSISNDNVNCRYLSDVKLSTNLKGVSELNQDIFDKVTVVLMSIPTQHMRSILASIKPFLKLNHLLIFVNKGIEISTGLLPHDIASEMLGNEMGARTVYLSGPSFAAEVVRRQPTCVAVASKSSKRAKRTQRFFHAPCFRVYHIEDTTGLEVAGALKNVIAIASGACTGAGFQMNASAALITRGLAEITRFGIAMNANPLTFAGFSGVGDLFLTCTSEKSRNFTVGYRLGKGEKLDDIISSLGSVAEGVPTTKAAYELARKHNVDSPITDQVYAVLYENKPIDVAFKELMERDPSAELRGISEPKTYFFSAH
ncbi:6-phosphogluconate dehydrogenase [Globomyces pollinis-pini]|nr:6-phosphogluconate dehydrogenase [Globomyces pollinis-pini]